MLNDVIRGNIQYSALAGPALTPAVVAPNTTAEQTFTVAGLQVGDFVNVTKPTVQAGLGIVNSRVSAANTLAIGFVNATSATITPTAGEIYTVNMDRPIGALPANFT
jgi:hypothetical protein